MFSSLLQRLPRPDSRPQEQSGVPEAKRRFVVRGAAIGLSVALPARLWMRTISQHHVFSVGGTLLIIFVFTGMGAMAGVVTWWRRNPAHPRALIVRAVGIAPFALLGPFTLLFIPSLIAAATAGHPDWKRWARRGAIVAGVVFFSLTELILLTSDAPGNAGVRLASGLLYLPLAYASFLTIRLALDPLPAQGRTAISG